MFTVPKYYTEDTGRASSEDIVRHIVIYRDMGINYSFYIYQVSKMYPVHMLPKKLFFPTRKMAA